MDEIENVIKEFLEIDASKTTSYNDIEEFKRFFTKYSIYCKILTMETVSIPDPLPQISNYLDLDINTAIKNLNLVHDPVRGATDDNLRVLLKKIFDMYASSLGSYYWILGIRNKENNTLYLKKQDYQLLNAFQNALDLSHSRNKIILTHNNTIVSNNFSYNRILVEYRIKLKNLYMKSVLNKLDTLPF